MSMSIPFPGIQSRSRETADLILDAVVQLMLEGGQEACTVAAVAQRAGRGIGSIYRRFGDKHALLKAAVLHYVGGAPRLNDESIRLMLGAARGLDDIVRMLLRGILDGRRQHQPMHRAIRELARAGGDAELSALPQALRSRSMPAVAALLLHFRDEIAHADAEGAVDFALSCALDLIEARDDPQADEADRAAWTARLADMVLAYLRHGAAQ